MTGECSKPQGASTVPMCDANCVIKSYHAWIDDAEYDWPPKCPCCNRAVPNNPDTILRLSCYCLYHKDCWAGVVREALQDKPEELMNDAIDGLKCVGCQVMLLGTKTSKLKENMLGFTRSVRADVLRARERSVAPVVPADIPSEASAASNEPVEAAPDWGVSRRAGPSTGDVEIGVRVKGRARTTRHRRRCRRGHVLVCVLVCVLLLLVWFAPRLLASSPHPEK